MFELQYFNIFIYYYIYLTLSYEKKYLLHDKNKKNYSFTYITFILFIFLFVIDVLIFRNFTFIFF